MKPRAHLQFIAITTKGGDLKACAPRHCLVYKLRVRWLQVCELAACDLV